MANAFNSSKFDTVRPAPRAATDFYDSDNPKQRHRAKVEPLAVRITQQFRERHNMTYELDCSGVPLIVRVFFPAEDGSTAEWRIEAQVSHAPDGFVATAAAPSRVQALKLVAQSWQSGMPPTSSTLDWNAVAQAMTAVRAV